MKKHSSYPIGVFDSGVGGLTVYRALRAVLPSENFLYLGDTARLPYGTKSADTIAQYVLEAAGFLKVQGIKLLVVACHTASAQALPSLREQRPDLPCLGVIAPTLDAAIKASHGGRIAVLATEGTVRAGIYPEMLRALKPGADIEMLACQSLVTLAEEGKWEGAEAETAIRYYLNQLKPGFDTLVLGCTHFPLLAPTILKIMPKGVALIDSASVTARVVVDFLDTHHLRAEAKEGKSRFLVTGDPSPFAAIAERFLNETVTVERAIISSAVTVVPFDVRHR